MLLIEGFLLMFKICVFTLVLCFVDAATLGGICAALGLVYCVS